MTPLEHERRVNLIIENTHVVPFRQLAQPLLLGQRKHLADRIVRIAQHERMAASRERVFDGVEIEQPFAFAGRFVGSLKHFDFDHVDVVQLRHAQERHVRGRRHDHGIAGADQLAQEDLVRFQHVRHHADDVRIHVPAVVAFLPAGAHLGHAALPRFGNVTEFAMVAGAVDGLLDARRQAVVHFRDERADTAGVAGPLVGTDFGQICGGGAIDGIGIKAGKNTILLFHAFQHSRRPGYACCDAVTHI